MGYGKMRTWWLPLLITAVLVLLAAGVGAMEPTPAPDPEVNIPFSVMAMLDGEQEPLGCWEDAAGNYLVFLPSGADLSEVMISPVETGAWILDGKPLEEELRCSGFEPDTAYALSCTEGDITGERTVTFLQSARLPSLHLDVQSGSMDIIHADKGNQESGHFRLYSPEGRLAASGRMEGLKGRGNSSWLRDKKPYSMTLAQEEDLLGMAQAQNWILLANAMDPSHLRNKAVYDLAAGTGLLYAPESRWVDLYLNGEYAGLYLLCERNEIHPQRMDFPETGSFLVSRESRWRLISQNYPRVLLDSGAALRIHDSGLTEEELQRIWQPAENAILSEDGVDPQSGKQWQELIDLDSWVMDYLTSEIFGNVDAGTISQYFYRDGSDSSGKIYAGPVWDYDLSMGSRGTWQTQTVKAFFGDKAHIWSLEDSTWFYGLNRKPEFQNRVKELYQNVYRPLVLEFLETGLEAYAHQIQQAAALDQRRWGTAGMWEETAYIRDYLTRRLRFLDDLWLENVPYCKVLVILDENSSSVCHAVLPGETVPALPDYEQTWDVVGWYDAETEEPFDPARPIYRDTTVYLKKLPGEEDQISPLQAVPIAIAVVFLLAAVLTDRKRSLIRTTKGKDPVDSREKLEKIRE